MLNQPELTGYPSIDKPWRKYWREQPYREVIVERTVYENIFELNKSNMEMPALGYFGRTISFTELKEKADIMACAFRNSRITAGDVVLVGLPLCPEAIITFLALDKIGAISRWFDLRCGVSDISAYLQESNCRIAVTIDGVSKFFSEVIDDTCLKTVITLNPVESAGPIAKILYNARNPHTRISDVRFITFKQFLSSAEGNIYRGCVPYVKDRPTIMLQSSGTTGKPKVIVHTDYSINHMIRKVAFADYPIGLGIIAFNVIPPWVAYGLVNGTLDLLAMGTKIELFPTLEPNSVYRYIGKYNAALAVPIHFRYLQDHYSSLSERKRRQLRQVLFVSGGDKISIEEIEIWEKTFGAKILNGYGSSECLGGVCINPFNHNKYGTVGIPRKDIVIAAFDTDTGRELGFGERGELCIRTDSVFLEYLNNPTETSSIKVTHNDGLIWYHTGDLGFVDEEGYITLLGRTRRVITRAGFKISAYLIEQKITELDEIAEACVVEAKDEIEEHVPFAFIKLKKNVSTEDITGKVLTKCRKELKVHEIPKYVKVIEEIPYTPNRKYDISQLEEMAKEMAKEM